MAVGDSMSILNEEYYPDGVGEDSSPKSYIAKLARNSVHSMQASKTADAIYEGLSFLNPDDRSWTPSYLRKEFDRTNIEEHYRKYHRRLLQVSFKRYLFMQFGISLVSVVFFLAINYADLLQSLPDIIVHSILLGMCLCLYLIVNQETFVQSIPYFYQVVSVLVPYILLGLDLGLQAYYKFSVQDSSRFMDRTHVPWAFCVIIVVYAFMPIRRDWVAMLTGGFISASYLIFSGVVLYSQREDSIIQRLFADAVYYFCINCLGVISRFLEEITLRRSFAERRNCVESRFKLDYEKEEEEKLLLSIIPKHIAGEVSNDLRKAVRQPLRMINQNDGYESDSSDEEEEEDNSGGLSLQRSMSDKMAPYSKPYHNISILFADIVNFTPLTTTLKVRELVALLNDLFGQFDAAAERHNCLRIKILGDCYYCVSGMPTATEDHAINCVKMGLDMIGVIAAVRAERAVNVDMRIGVHTGSVVSGLIGIRKWQFDIWSTDTTIANRMEQSGKPGRVHVTRQTLDQLRGTFDYEPSDGAASDSFLSSKGIETFLVIADPPSHEFIQSMISSPPAVTVQTTDLVTEITIEGDNGESNDYDGDSDVSSESGIEADRELTERRLRKLYKIFPLEYVADFEEESVNDDETREQDSRTVSQEDIRKRNDSSLRSVSATVSSEDGLPAPDQKRLFEKKGGGTAQFGGGAAKKMTDMRSNSVVPRRRSTTTNNPDDAPQGRNRTASSTKSLEAYSGLRTKANEYMKNVIDTIPISNFKRSDSQQFDGVTMLFKKRKWEIPYTTQIDPLFKYYHMTALFVLSCIMAIQLIMGSYGSAILWGIFGVSFVALSCVFPFLMANQIWMNKQDPNREENYVPPPTPDLKLMYFLFDYGQMILKSFKLRIMIFAATAVSVVTLAIVEVANCPPMGTGSNSTTTATTMCNYPWYFTFCCALALATVNIFVRVHFVVKFVLYSVAFSIYTSVILDLKVDLFEAVLVNDFASGTPALSPEIAHVMYLATVVVVLHVIDRKEEFIYRLDFVLKNQLRKEQKLANETRIVNKILLQNILPVHVAKEYLSEGRSEDQLYSETHTGVAVMFASIPEFAEFWELNFIQDKHNNGISALKTLNVIIAEFDELFFETRFSCIEKIKVIGSTYMAACGLADNFSASQNGSILVDFATEMAKKLDSISKDAQFELRLRVGLECGPVIAGVVGQHKPLYDIWGDTVNMASRMDYTGEAGRIHVTESTARLLMQKGIYCEKRGITYVKGKGDLLTYWARPLDIIEEAYETEDL